MKIKTIFLLLLITITFQSNLFANNAACSFFALSNVGTLAVSTASFLGSYYIAKKNVKNQSEETQLLEHRNYEKYDKYSRYSLCCGFVALAIATGQFFGYMIIC